MLAFIEHAGAPTPIWVDLPESALALLEGLRRLHGANRVRSESASDEDVAFTVQLREGDAPPRFARVGERVIHVTSPLRLIDAVVAIRQGLSMWHSATLDHYHAAAVDLAPDDGASVGIGLFGASGGGKSTLLSALAQRVPLRVVTEDWGVVDHRTRLASGDANVASWHLKRATAASYGALLVNLKGEDPSDADRGFFMPRQRIAAVELTRAIVIAPAGLSVHPYRPDDLEWMRAGTPSQYYGANERWLDGATQLFNQAEDDRHARRLHALLSLVPTLVLPRLTNPEVMVDRAVRWAVQGE